MDTVAVIGVSPRGWRGEGRFGRLADFQKQVGEIGEPGAGDFWGGHAVCHGLMNGVSRVVYSAVEDVADAAEVAGAVARLRGQGPLAAVVAPGGAGLAWARGVVEAWVALRRGAGEALGEGATLWLDAPDDGAGPLGVLGFARALGAKAQGVCVVGPWVSTQSPGCWRAAKLPGSCLVAPLWLGATAHLRGAHDLSDARLDPATQAALEEAGAGWLRASGVRRQVVLQTPHPKRAEAQGERPPVTLDERIRAALQEATQEALEQGLAQGPKLWKQIERRAYSALMAFAAGGEVVAFDLRCDAETNDGSAQPVVSVQYRTPQRVQRLSIRLGALGG
jgi:hypothetical protein